MASSSTRTRKCSDEELQKALADLHEYVAQNPIPDEFKYLGPEDEEYTKKKERDKDKKNKKTKTCKVLAADLQAILSYKCCDARKKYGYNDSPEMEEEREKDKNTKILDSVSDTFLRHWDDFICAQQEKIRQELQTKGYITYEVTDDEDEEEVVVPAGARGGGGRRRHRPGVTKTAGGVVKKLN